MNQIIKSNLFTFLSGSHKYVAEKKYVGIGKQKVNKPSESIDFIILINIYLFTYIYYIRYFVYRFTKNVY